MLAILNSLNVLTPHFSTDFDDTCIKCMVHRALSD